MRKELTPEEIEERRETASNRAKQRADVNAEDKQQQKAAIQEKYKKKNCPRNPGGFDYDNVDCIHCSAGSECEIATPKTLKTVAYHLGKLGYDYNEESWTTNYDDFNINDERNKIIDFAWRLSLSDEVEDPVLISKIKALPDLTHKFLKQHVPDWWSFKRGIEKRIPYVPLNTALNRLAKVWKALASDAEYKCTWNMNDSATEGCNTDDLYEAFACLIENGSTAQKREVLESHIILVSDYLEGLRNSVAAELGGKKKKDKDKLWPTDWMKKDKKIMEMLQKHQHFAQLMIYLCTHHFNYKESQMGMQQREIAPYQTGDKKDKTYILLQLDMGKMEKEVGLSAKPLYKYIQELVRIGAMKKLAKDGPRGQYIYALGYWSPVPGETYHRTVWFLKNTPAMRKSLREFTPYHAKVNSHDET